MITNKRSFVWIILGLLLIAAALFLIGYNTVTQDEAEEASEHVLERLDFSDDSEEENELPDYEIPEYVKKPNIQMPVKTIDGYDYIGKLYIESLQIELPVMSEWSYPGLKIAPCRYYGSIYQDNLVIVAHNYKRHFGNIKTLKQGNIITFTDISGNVFKFAVIEVEVLEPIATEQMITGEWDLTLFTCTIGGASRVTVRCERIS